MKAEDKALWLEARTVLAEDGSAAEELPDPLVLAAYLDGSLEERAREALETRLAAQPEAMELLLAAQDALEAGPADDLPESLLTRAQGILREAPAAQSEGSPGFSFAAWLTGSVGWAGVAAAMLVACLIGFELGQAGSANAATMASALAQEATLGLDTLAGPLL